jgi:hypothetical protein
VIYLTDGWRVAYDPLQWILQRQQGGRWRDRSFCVTREGLRRCIRDHVGDEADISAVLRLPEWHPDRAAAGAAAEILPTIPTERLPGPMPPSVPLEEAA